MPAAGLYRRCAPVAFALCAAAFAACQSSNSARSNEHAGAKSSFDVSMAAVTEADFAQRHQFYYYPVAGVYRDCDDIVGAASNPVVPCWDAGGRAVVSPGMVNVNEYGAA